MNLDKIKSGNIVPNDINVIIEISNNENNIKYEIDKNTGSIYVDRFINTPIFYPFNYGFINKTLSLDKDPLDVVIPIYKNIIPGSIINCRPIGILKMIDESGEDNKIIAIPNLHISNEFNNINEINDLSKLILDKIIFFFENYKKLDKNKWSKVIKYENKENAKIEILNSINRYLSQFNK